MRSLIVSRNGTFRTDLPVTALGEALSNPTNVVWLDICDPTPEDVELLRHELKVHPLAIEDAIRSHERPKVEAYPSYYFLVFYTARYVTNGEGHVDVQPVSLFIGANYLVSVHEGAIRHVDETLARWQAPNSPLGNKVPALVHALLDAMVDDYFPLMDQVADRVEDLEDAIFAHFEQQAIQEIFDLKKDLLTLRRVVAPERDVLNVLLRRDLPIFKAQDMAYLQDVYDHIVRVTDNIDTYRDLLSSALDSYLSIQSNNLNQVMKILTMGSILLMTSSLIAGIYGMNFHFMPELSWRYGYFYALGLMAALSTGIIVYFRRRGWW